jgi:hypothetical protein
MDVEQGQSLLCQTGPLNCLGMPACRVKQGEIKTHSQIGTVARCVGVVFTTDLDTDRLFPNLENLANLKNDWYCQFPVVGGSVPVCRRLCINGESRMGLRRIGNKWLDEHRAVTAAAFLDHDRPKLVHQCAYGPAADLLQYHDSRSNRECAGAQQRMGSGRVKQCRSDTPNQSERAGLLRREKKLWSVSLKPSCERFWGCRGEFFGRFGMKNRSC